MAIESGDFSRRKKSVKGFASKVFKESSVSAVSAIVSADSYPRKIFRVLVFLLFTAGFIYQCVKFLGYIFGYPTVVNIEMIAPREYLAPAFTFCNFNKIKRSKFCGKFPTKCYVPDEEFCEEYPFYCSGNMTPMPKEEYFPEDERVEFSLDISHEIDDLFKSVNDFRFLSETPTGPWLRQRSKRLDDITQCFSLNTRMNSTKYPLFLKKAYLWEDATFKFVFNPEENEMFNPNAKPGILFSIHSPFIAVNPFKNGIFLKAGYLYKIVITMEESTLLPFPYKTDCTNYTEIWLKNNRTGPRSQEMCQELCLLKSSHFLLNCTPAFAFYPSEIKPCFINFEKTAPRAYSSTREMLLESGINRYLSENLENSSHLRPEDMIKADEMLETCQGKCKDDCYTLKYIKEIQETYVVPQWKKNITKNAKPRLIKVEIYFDDTEVLSLRYKPQYQQVEVFSYIGGFVGIWLGVSLVQIADILESLFRIIRYVFRKSTLVCKWKNIPHEINLSHQQRTDT